MKDKVVVITGASAGIGAALAELVGARGGRPVLAARREETLREVAARSGPQSIAIPCDVTRRADVQKLVDETIARAGRIDVLVNNAGRGITRLPSALTDEEFDEMMLVNVKSALYGMQSVLPHFKARGRGHVINVSSMIGRIPFVTIRSAYNAAKAALNMLTANFRVELHATHPEIHFSTVLPGVVATDFGRNALGGGPDSRALPMAQPVGEVAEVIASLIEDPRAEAYSRPEYKDQVIRYYGDVDAAESRPPFVTPPRP